MVNDCDFISSLRYTVKGPNSLGSGKSERNIGVKYRGTDVSYIGSLDINVYSSSSPGLNGSLTPFAHAKGLYFSDEPEAQDKEYQIYEDLVNQSQSDGYECIKIGHDALSYYDSRFDIAKNAHDNFNVMINKDPSFEYIRIINDDDTKMI
jgi:hypothetical protein